MTTPDKTLLILGIVLFAVLVVALLIFLAKGKSITPLLAFFILPVGMIGFSEIKDWKGPWGEIDMKNVSDYANDPNNSNSIVAFNQTLDQIEKVQAENPGAPVPPQIHSNLVSTVKMLSLRSNLTPESRLALSRAQFCIGETNNAVKTATAVVAANTNMLHLVDPRLRIMLKPNLIR
jgi:hypothetical protein